MRAGLITVITGIILACTGDAAATGEPGAPLPGLRDVDLARFRAGQALFDKVYTPPEGLGPTFNENQCSACHTRPASGGTSGFERVVKATRFTAPAACDPLREDGGVNIRSQATPLLQARGVHGEAIPSRATAVGRFTPPFLFGLGLVEAIPDERILAAEDPDDRNHDGISGRAGRTPDGRVARFGRKAEFATVREFVETALRLEMGLTAGNAVDAVNGKPAPRAIDPVPDPEVGRTSVDLLTAFVRLLAAPAALSPVTTAQRDTIAEGRRIFTALGCTGCHTPVLRTGMGSDIPALNNRAVPLYSDLLLHDMGPGLADVCGYTATPAELRTEPLMGVGRRDRLLHDGRTDDLREAILAHGGEAQRSRDAFARLPWLRQEYLVIFLRSR